MHAMPVMRDALLKARGEDDGDRDVDRQMFKTDDHDEG